MVKIVDASEVPQRRNDAYPWHTWFIYNRWTRLERGVDYKVETPYLRTLAYKKAKAMGVKIETRTEKGNNAIYIHLTTPLNPANKQVPKKRTAKSKAK